MTTLAQRLPPRHLVEFSFNKSLPDFETEVKLREQRAKIAPPVTSPNSKIIAQKDNDVAAAQKKIQIEDPNALYEDYLEEKARYATWLSTDGQGQTWEVTFKPSNAEPSTVPTTVPLEWLAVQDAGDALFLLRRQGFATMLQSEIHKNVEITDEKGVRYILPTERNRQQKLDPSEELKGEEAEIESDPKSSTVEDGPDDSTSTSPEKKLALRLFPIGSVVLTEVPRPGLADFMDIREGFFIKAIRFEEDVQTQSTTNNLASGTASSETVALDNDNNSTVVSASTTSIKAATHNSRVFNEATICAHKLGADTVFRSMAEEKKRVTIVSTVNVKLLERDLFEMRSKDWSGRLQAKKRREAAEKKKEEGPGSVAVVESDFLNSSDIVDLTNPKQLQALQAEAAKFAAESDDQLFKLNINNLNFNNFNGPQNFQSLNDNVTTTAHKRRSEREEKQKVLKIRRIIEAEERLTLVSNTKDFQVARVIHQAPSFAMMSQTRSHPFWRSYAGLLQKYTDFSDFDLAEGDLQLIKQLRKIQNNNINEENDSSDDEEADDSDLALLNTMRAGGYDIDAWRARAENVLLLGT